MPLYLATPKKSGSLQADGSRFTEYNRSRPSAMFLIATTAGSLLVPAYITAFMYILTALYWADDLDKNARVTTLDVRTSHVNVATDQQIPLELPYVEFKFSSNAHTGSEVKWLESKGASTMKIGQGGRNSDVFRLNLGSLSEDDIVHLLGFSAKLDSKFRSTAEFISFSSIRPAIRIRNMLSAILKANMNMVDMGESGIAYAGNGKAFPPGEKWSTIDNLDSASIIAVDEKEVKMYKPDDIFIGLQKGANLNESAWGEMKDKPEKPGLAIPFVKNYASPDTDGLNWFLKEFYRMLAAFNSDVVVEAGNLQRAWRTDIYLTKYGLEVAHIVKVLELCLMSGTSVFSLFAGNVFCGCFMVGSHFMITRNDGVTFEGVTNVEGEWASLSIHAAALEAIRKIAGLPASWDEPKTMRRLRTMVFSGGEPSGVIKNRISELLVDLSFPEAPDSINSSTIESTLEYLCSDMFIPDTMYLDRRSFFSEKRDILVLSRFGFKAPSFSTGSKLVKFCSDARGPGVSAAAAYSHAAPVPLQVVRKPVLSAALDWANLLRTGTAHINATSELPGSFVFRGSDRGKVWGSMQSHIASQIRKDAEVATGGGNEKRDLEEGEIDQGDGNVHIGVDAKKVRII